MAIGAAGTGGMLPTNRRKPLLRTFLNLYRGEFAFQGMVDFAVIGAAVLLFLHPPSKDDLRSWLSLVGIGADRSSTMSQQPAVSIVPTQQPVAQLPPAAAKPKPTPPPTSQPAQPAQPAGPPSKPIVFPPEIAKPTLANTMLVEISETAFRNSPAADQQRLLAARLAYRSGRGSEIVDLLADADGRNPNVAFMRGLGLMVRGDEASVRAGEAALRTAAEANHTLAKVLLGVMLVTAPKGMTKNVDEGRRLIEAATAAGDPQAQRVAAIAYISAEFGSFDPGRAASLFKRAAEAGDPQAMFHYARVLSEGIGVPASQADAVDFLSRAAAAGLTSAQFALGSWQLDQYGANALSDPSEGVGWLERAMQRGFLLVALNKLQHLYGWMGREAPWNDKARYFALAKQCSGLVDAYCQYSYSIASSNGWGTAKEPVRAYVHALVARDLGNVNVTVKTIDDLGATLTAPERADAMERARALRQKLKPAPELVVFQYQDVDRPSPWASVEEVEAAAQPQPQQSPAQGSVTPRPAAPAAATMLAGLYRADGVDPGGNRYSGMVALATEGDGYHFTWWVDGEVQSGTGRFAGRTLVVDFGQPHPAIYTFGNGDRLDGTWANGSATERLELFAHATEGAAPPPQGRYNVAGHNPDGTSYSGTVIIANQSGRFHVEWRTGTSNLRGTGTLQGNLLTIDWGSATPVVYALAADGTLRGLWDGGKGEETLTPERSSVGADASPAHTMKPQDISFGSLKSVGVPASWVRSQDRAVLPASRLKFAPDTKTRYGIFVFDAGLPISSTSAKAIRDVYVANAKITAPVSLTPDQIEGLSPELGNVGDNQYSNKTKWPDVDAPTFKISTAQAVPMNGKVVVKLDGSFVDNAGQPKMSFVGLFTPSDTGASRMISMYTQSTDQNEFSMLRSVFEKMMSSIVWRR